MNNELKNQLTTALLSCPIVYIPHFHYHLIDDTLREVLRPKQGRRIFDGIDLESDVIEFDCGRNCVVDFETKDVSDYYPGYNDIKKLLRALLINDKLPQPSILLLKNFSSKLENEEVQSLLAMFACKYEKGDCDKATTIIIISPQEVSSLPKELEKYITIIEVKPPDQDEILDLLKAYPVSERHDFEENELRMDLCRTLQGLQYYEIKQILNSALVRTGMIITATTKRLALEEKKNIVRKSGIIEVVDPNESFDQIGGLDVLKKDLLRKATVYRNLNEAQSYNVPLPKGVLIIGMPGCGKTMIAKSVANLFGVSLLRLDVSRLMGKYVGESETNLRLALATAEAVHPCVLWIDEIEKAFAGSDGQNTGNSDMLVMRLMGHFLTWMQERTTPVFIVATANDVMRPEFMRKGRFDDVYFVDFPKEKERTEILRSMLEPYRTNRSSVFDFSAITDDACDVIIKDMEGTLGGFSGAEIKSVVNMVIEQKFVEYTRFSHQEKKSGNKRVPVTVADFKQVVEGMKDSVMASQVSKMDPETKQRHKTAIERIKEMQEKYHFKEATSHTPKKKK